MKAAGAGRFCANIYRPEEIEGFTYHGIGRPQ